MKKIMILALLGILVFCQNSPNGPNIGNNQNLDTIENKDTLVDTVKTDSIKCPNRWRWPHFPWDTVDSCR